MLLESPSDDITVTKDNPHTERQNTYTVKYLGVTYGKIGILSRKVPLEVEQYSPKKKFEAPVPNIKPNTAKKQTVTQTVRENIPIKRAVTAREIPFTRLKTTKSKKSLKNHKKKILLKAQPKEDFLESQKEESPKPNQDLKKEESFNSDVPPIPLKVTKPTED